MTLSFSPGSLIAARGREWVVIETRDGGAMMRPLGGLDQDTQLFVPSLEQSEAGTVPAAPRRAAPAAPSRRGYCGTFLAAISGSSFSSTRLQRR